MDNKEEDWKTLKIVLRCLLLSTQNGLTRREILTQYKQGEGKNLPVRYFGFSTPEDMFSELKDVMQVRYFRGEAVYVGVDVPETAHITKMISKQRPKRNARRPAIKPIAANDAGTRVGGRLHRAGGLLPAPPPRNSQSRSSPFGSQTRDFGAPSAQGQAYVPPQMRGGPQQQTGSTTLDSGIILPAQHPTITPTQAAWGAPIRAQEPTQQGQLQKFMQPSQQEVRNNGSQPKQKTVPPVIQNNIRVLLEKEPNGIMGSILQQYYEKRFGQRLDYNRFGFGTLLEMLQAMEDVAYVAQRAAGYRVFSLLHGKALEAKNVAQSTAMLTTPRMARAPPKEEEKGPRGDSEERGERKRHRSRKSVEEDPHVPAEIKQNIKKVLSNFSGGLAACHMLTEYRLTHNVDLNLQRLGYSSVVELMAAIPQVVTIERPEATGDWYLFDAEMRRPTALTEKSNPEIPQVRTNWRQDLKKLIDDYQDGLYLHELQDIYRAYYDNELDPPLLGYPSLFDMMMDLRGEIIRDIEHVSSDKILIHRLDSEDPKERLAPLNRGPAIARPDDIVLPGEKFLPLPIPDAIKDSGWFPLLVSHVQHPGQLSVQLMWGTDESNEPLEALMDELEFVYKKTKEGDLYVIPDDEIEVGMVCAAVFPDGMDFHRCVLTRLLANGDVLEVYYVDYGGTSRIDRKWIRYLKREFLDLPAQALDATLHGITAIGFWTKPGKEALLRMTSNRTLLGSLRVLEDRRMHLCLCDTQGERDVHINDKLVELGHAKFEDYCKRENNESKTSGGCATSVERHPSESDSQGSERIRRYTKKIELTGLYSCHLINLDGRPYLSSPEINDFLWGEQNKLSNMIHKKRMTISDKMNVLREEYEDLFNELDQLKIKNLSGRVSCLIYPLNEVPNILETFKHPEKALIARLRQLAESFNANDPYWTNEDDDDTFENDINKISLDELQTMLKMLQYKRQASLASLAKGNPQQTVDELRNIEIQMNSVSKKIKSLENEGHKSESALTETEKYAVDCVTVQYGSPDKAAKSSMDNIATSVAGLSTSQTEKVSPSVNRVAPMPKTSTDVTSSFNVTSSDSKSTSSEMMTTSGTSDATSSCFAAASAVTTSPVSSNVTQTGVTAPIMTVPDPSIRQTYEQAYQQTVQNMCANNTMLMAQRRMMTNTVLASPYYNQPGVGYMPNIPPLQAHMPAGAVQYQPLHYSPQTAQYAPAQTPYITPQQQQYALLQQQQQQQQGLLQQQQQQQQLYGQQQQYYGTAYSNSGLPMNWPPQ